MKWRALPILLLTGLSLRAQDAPTVPPVAAFTDSVPQTTPKFTVADGWEVRWRGVPGMNVSILAEDNSVVAGSAAFFGALYLAKGGTYHLQIDCTATQKSGEQSHSQSGFEKSLNSGGFSTGGSNQNSSPNAPGMRAWRVEVLQMSSPGAQTMTGMPNYTLPTGDAPPTGSLAAAVPTPAATPTPIPEAAAPAAASSNGTLSNEQAKAVVLIKGDKAEGTGFLVRTPTGPVVITNIHVMADNPNLKISTSTGALVNVLSEKGAADRDLAMLSIEDKGYSYLEMAPDISSVVQTGDAVITPGNSQGGEVMLNTSGTVLGIGPVRVEISNPIYHGNSGGPVFHPKSNKVLGVVTQAQKVDMSNDLDKASFASRNSAISGEMRYFALRIDTVAAWINIDPRRFQIETTFLEQFQEQSRRLDSFLNTSDRNSGDDAKLYLTDEKIMKANNEFQAQGSDSDTAQRIQGLREMLFALQGICDSNMDQVSVKQNFYGFDQERAADEFAYRKALRTELDSIGNNVERLGHMPRRN